MKFQQLMTSVLKCQCEAGWNKLRVWCRHCESHAALQRDCCWMLQMKFRRWGGQRLVGTFQKLTKKATISILVPERSKKMLFEVPAHFKAWAHSEGMATSTNQIPGTRTEEKKKGKIKLAIFYSPNKLSYLHLWHSSLKKNLAWDDFCHDVLLKRGQCAWSRGILLLNCAIAFEEYLQAIQKFWTRGAESFNQNGVKFQMHSCLPSKSPVLHIFWLVSGGGVRLDPVSVQGMDHLLEVVPHGVW